MSDDRLWWQHGVVYQIYPRSYQDASGDGIGDLEGIRQRLDHLAWLGVDALWLSPFQPSPMADFGYDVADYCGVDPLFGTLDDFDRLLADAHQRGIRVTLDWVPNHSSDQHPWFLESRAARNSAKRDWYVWRDGRGDGPPNNWVSVFGGPAWEHDPATGQWYLHSFLRCPWDANALRTEVERFEVLCPPEGWPTWVLSNHDVPRHASRYDDPALGDARARTATMMLLTLRGTPYLYAGEEIGMRNVAVPPDRLQDPLARTLHPALSRDGERTPMRWDAREPNCGCTAARSDGTAVEPWLPLGPQPPGTDVASQRADRRSLLWLYRDLLALRRAHPSLHRGSWRAIDAPEGVFAYERRHGSEVARIALNFADTPRRVPLGGGSVAGGLSTRPDTPLPRTADTVELGPADGLVLVLR